MARKATHVKCPHCGDTVPAPRLASREITEHVMEQVLDVTGVDPSAWDEAYWDADDLDALREEKRQWRAERRKAHKELAMGPYVWNIDPPVYYYRRIRRCSSCEEIYATAEVDEDLISELDELRDLKAAVDAEAARAASALNKIRRRLKR